jgi:hypothetical protein
MRRRSMTTHIMRTTAIALPLLGAPFTVKIVDQGLQVAAAEAWAESDHGGDHGSDGGSDHGSSGGSDHGSSGGSDHGSSSGSDDHGGSGGDQGGSNDGSRDGSLDQSQDQERSQDQDRLEQDRDAWLGAPERSQGASAQGSAGDVLVPVPEAQERQLIERGWASDDAQGDHQ